MVHNSTGCPHNHINSSPESPDLRVDRFTAIYRKHLKLFIKADVADLFGHLYGKFTGRLEYKSKRLFRALKHLGNRYAEGCGLACSCLGLADHIQPIHNCWNG